MPGFVDARSCAFRPNIIVRCKKCNVQNMRFRCRFEWYALEDPHTAVLGLDEARDVFIDLDIPAEEGELPERGG